MSGLSMPMPNAEVATTTSAEPSSNCSCARAALGRPQAAVVRDRSEPSLGEQRRVGRRVAAGRDVEEAGHLQPGHRVDHRLPAVAVLDVAPHVEVEVRSVEAAHEDERVAQVEPLDDLVPHRARGGRREGQHRRVAEAVDDGAEAQVVRPEVVAPRRDAVRLVDDDLRDPLLAEARDDLVAGQLLRGQEEDHPAGLLDRRHTSSVSAAPWVEFSARAGGPAGASSRAVTWSRWSAMRGETTTVTPSSRAAGSWYSADFPCPVGMTATTSRPDMVACSASS